MAFQLFTTCVGGSPRGADVGTGDQELMALSVLTLLDGVVHHTHSAYHGGTDALLDRTPTGRNEGAVDG